MEAEVEAELFMVDFVGKDGDADRNDTDVEAGAEGAVKDEDDEAEDLEPDAEVGGVGEPFNAVG